MGDSACYAHLLDDDGRLLDPPGVRIQRVYDRLPAHGEVRVLVDRVWPRGVRKQELAADRWARDLAPSADLRRWFGHDPRRWEEFRRRYRTELAHKAEELDELAAIAGRRPLVLLYSAQDREHNQAVVLKQLIEKRLGERLSA